MAATISPFPSPINTEDNINNDEYCEQHCHYDNENVFQWDSRTIVLAFGRFII